MPDNARMCKQCPTSPQKAYEPANHIPPMEYRAFLERCLERYRANRQSGTTFQLNCPAVAYGYTHEMYAADPQCWREVA